MLVVFILVFVNVIVHGETVEQKCQVTKMLKKKLNVFPLMAHFLSVLSKIENR